MTKITVEFCTDVLVSKNQANGVRNNRIYSTAKKKKALQVIEGYTRAALHKHQASFKQAKVWLSIFIQKRDHRLDVVNYIDILCDGLKHGIGVDDKWFSLSLLDWEINKENPKTTIDISQTD